MQNALLQAQRFGARITVPCTVRSLGLDGGDRVVTLHDGTRLRTRCVLVASGVDYRRLDLPHFADFEGAGIYYAATEMEARLCRGEEVVVVGAGNSAGQAIVYLAYARRVHVVCAGAETSMSRYLVDRMESIDNVTVHRACKVAGLEGRTPDRCPLQQRHRGDAALRTTRSSSLSAPTRTRRGSAAAWSSTATASCSPAPSCRRAPPRASMARRRAPPYLLETSLPGVFAAGDVAQLGQALRVRRGRRRDGGELRARPHRATGLGASRVFRRLALALCLSGARAE